MNRYMVKVAVVLGASALLVSGCAKKPDRRADDRRKAAAIRARSDDAFADLANEERARGMPAPKPDHKRVTEDELRPKPKAKEPEIEKKPVDTVPVNPARVAPAWVNSQPNMPGYYVGIGVATSSGDEGNDWKKARNSAYVELASTLKVHIQGVITDYFREKNLKLYKGDSITKDTTRQDASYAQDTQFFVDQTLEGVEIADRWKDKGQRKYWMLVRLSKAEIQRRLQERLDKARNKAVDYVKAAIKAEQAGNLAAAFKGYFKSYLALREYFGGIVKYDMDGDGKPEILNHEIERAVDRLADSLTWKPENANRKGVNGRGLDEPLVVDVTFKGNPVNGLPVQFVLERGMGSIESGITTDSSGVAKGTVIKLFGQKKAIASARVDAGALVDNVREARVLAAKFGNSLSRKTGKFYIELEELSAYISIEEELLGEELDSGGIASEVKDRLHKELGIVFTNSPRGADLEIKGKAVVEDCTDFYQQRRCTARVNVVVSDRAMGRQLFAKQLKISGNAEKDKEAGRNALAKVGRKIAKKIIEKLK